MTTKRFVVAYTVPVFVHIEIDEDGADIYEVSVGDEFTKLDESFGNCGVATYPEFTPASDIDRTLALDTADVQTWPAWSFG